MGKYDHICELTGAENYSEWSRKIMVALKGESLWNQCSSGADPSDYEEYASTKPVPAHPTAVTAEEKQTIMEWIAKDSKVKALFYRKVSTVIANQLNQNRTARQQWEILAQRYARSNSDFMSPYALRSKVRSEKLKDAEDAQRYLSAFEETRARFGHMDVSYPDDECIFDFLQGLPDSVEWQNFKDSVLSHPLSSTVLTQATVPVTSTTAQPLAFENVARLFIEKANAIVGRQNSVGTGSEYPQGSVNAPSVKTDPTTDLCINRNNPHGASCTNPLCAGLPRADNHVLSRCYWPGGGMEHKAPSWMRNSASKSAAAAASTSVTAPPSSTSADTDYSTHASSEDHGEWCYSAFVLPDEKSCSGSVTNTILSSSTTSHLIMGREYFTTFNDEDHPSVSTSTNGSLATTGRGTCVGELTIGVKKYRITLRDCLHAPGAQLNILSLHRLLQSGWSCTFRGAQSDATAQCDLAHKGRSLGHIPMVGNLFFVNLRLLRPDELSTP